MTLNFPSPQSPPKKSKALQNGRLNSELPTMSLPLLLSSLLIRPFPSSRHFTIPALLFPFHLALAPPAVFEKLQSPRHLHTARALERLAWAWLLLVILGAIYRTFDRVISGFNKSRGGSEEGKGDKNEAKDEQQDAKDGANGDRKEYERSIERGLSMSPIWTAAMCHLLAWRLATLPPAGVPGGWAWPWDVTTVVGLAGGAMSSWGEVWRLMRLVRPTLGEFTFPFRTSC